MIRLAKHLSLVGLLALGACHRKNADGTPVGMGGLPGSCSASAPASYSGAVVEGSCPPSLGNTCSTRHQYVSVQANVIDYPYDRVTVLLFYPDGRSQGIPSINIELGRGTVGIVNGLEAGYSRYEISEQLCR
jgi:hypothetical protein